MKKELVAEADQTFGELMSLLSSLTPEAFNHVPYENSWTPGQLATHLLKGYGGILEALVGATTAPQRPADAKVNTIKELFLNYDTRLKSPEMAVPEKKWYNQQEILAEIAGSKTKLTSAITLLDLSDLCTSFALPHFGHFTRLEWVSFILYHTQRHVSQLKRMVGAMDSQG